MVCRFFGAYGDEYPDERSAPPDIFMRIGKCETTLKKGFDEPYFKIEHVTQRGILNVVVYSFDRRSRANAKLLWDGGKAVFLAVVGGAFGCDIVSGKGQLFVTIRFEKFTSRNSLFRFFHIFTQFWRSKSHRCTQNSEM